MGVDKPEVKIVAKVIITNIDNQTIFNDNVEFVSDDSGQFIGEINLGYQENQILDISIKGEKHLNILFQQKKVSNGQIDLTEEKELFPGDLPWHNGQQDNKINSYDYDYLIGLIPSTNESDLDIADINYDGVVNNNDKSLFDKVLTIYQLDEL